MKNFTVALALTAGIAATSQGAMALEPYLPRTPKVFAKLDADSNGKISLAEFQTKAEKRFLRLDSNKDGAVSTAEIDQALQKALEARRNRILKTMDTDQDGSVSKAELDGAVAKLLVAADTDNDGGLTLDEASKYRVVKIRKQATGESSN